MLYSSGEVRRAIIKLFESSAGRRVAISAFVGEGAEVYLRPPENLELYCWPKPGSTNPNALRRLIGKGTHVFFADALHMKIYWTEDQGVIITSANLSTNALGSGNLKEIGILLESSEIDIDRVIQSLKPRHVKEGELRRLDVDPRDYYARNPTIFRTPKVQSFTEWYESLWRQKWKLALIDGDCETALIVEEILKNEYGISVSQFKNRNDLIAAPKNHYGEGDWILVVEHKKKPIEIKWLYADRVVNVPKSDTEAFDRKCPCQIFQVHPRKFYSSFPFDERDNKFKKALSQGIQNYGPERILNLKKANPPKRLLDLVSEYSKK